MILIKYIKLFNSLLAFFILLNIISYATGRVELFPVLAVGTLQILLGALVNAAGYKLKDLDGNE
ncbi:hypothetical protein AC622_01305 [Bacillus sp. FJAT-27916]|uniref:hypothetical protein n=1 Tax=Bacillaceae TaxID=186817 RepID=UPI0006708DC8|nr:hypothetical protein [Bacillus sp. FJAT-27916]KMY43060.1 hypothetical protein AC622_01305 [Bacillus sp. FJAT-27916]